MPSVLTLVPVGGNDASGLDSWRWTVRIKPVAPGWPLRWLATAMPSQILSILNLTLMVITHTLWTFQVPFTMTGAFDIIARHGYVWGWHHGYSHFTGKKAEGWTVSNPAKVSWASQCCSWDSNPDMLCILALAYCRATQRGPDAVVTVTVLSLSSFYQLDSSPLPPAQNVMGNLFSLDWR